MQVWQFYVSRLHRNDDSITCSDEDVVSKGQLHILYFGISLFNPLFLLISWSYIYTKYLFVDLSLPMH